MPIGYDCVCVCVCVIEHTVKTTQSKITHSAFTFSQGLVSSLSDVNVIQMISSFYMGSMSPKIVPLGLWLARQKSLETVAL